MNSGHFVIVWQDNSQTLGDTAISIIKAQAFTADGSKTGNEFLVNTPSPDPKVYPKIGTVGNGFAVAWKDWTGNRPAGSTKQIDVGCTTLVYAYEIFPYCP